MRRKASLVVVWILLMGCCHVFLTMVPENARATTRYVGGTGFGNYTTIQDAINASFSGDTVYVYNGTYYEHVKVSDRLSLLGEDRNTTIIDGGGVSMVVRILADRVSVTGFTIRNSGSTGGDYGVHLSLVQNCYIGYNNVSGNQIGIDLFRSHHNTIEHNIASNVEHGIFLSNSNNNTITNNNASSNSRFGINAGGSHDNIFADNFVSNNWDGISIGFSINNLVTNNTAINNENGIHLVDSINAVVYNNSVHFNEQGIEVWYDYNNTIANNTVTHSNRSGIYAHKTNNNTIVNNTILQNKYGIYLAYSDDNVVMYNLATKNTDTGMVLYMSNRTILVRNDVRDNDEEGFKVWMSWYNRIYHNTIAGNHDHESIDFWGYNYWDNGYPSGGNYWGDYPGDDERSGPNQDQPGYDGIGDIPYNVTGGSNQDLFPLMNSPFMSPPYPPYKPRHLTANGSNNQVLLTWDAPAYDGGSPITNYRIYRGTSIVDIEFLTEVGNVLEYTDDDVTVGRNYYYKVSAKNSVGESPLTDWVKVAPEASPNQVPVCAIESPIPGENVSGVYTIAGSSSDPDGSVHRVEVRIDSGSWHQATGTSSWTYDWDTTKVSSGLHTIHVRSYDGENYSETIVLSVYVDNPGVDLFWILFMLILVIVIVVAVVTAVVLARRRKKMPVEQLPLPPPETILREPPPPPPEMLEEELPPPPPPDDY